MPALTADRFDGYRKEGRVFAYPMAAGAIIYQGALVALNTSGYAVAASDTSGLRVVGVAVEQKRNTGSAGSVGAVVEAFIPVNLKGSGFAITDIGRRAFALSDSECTTAAGSIALVEVGHITEFVSSTEVWVFLRPQHSDPGIGTEGSGEFEIFGVAANANIAAGNIVLINTSGGNAGYAVPGGDTANTTIAGIAMHSADNTGGANDARKIVVRRRREFVLTTSGLAIGDVGKNALANGAGSFSASATANNIVIGKVTKFITATQGKVFVSP